LFKNGIAERDPRRQVMRFYIRKKDEKALAAFKYAGTDNSLLYKYAPLPLSLLPPSSFQPSGVSHHLV
jgi:hypothetical protein